MHPPSCSSSHKRIASSFKHITVYTLIGVILLQNALQVISQAIVSDNLNSTSAVLPTDQSTFTLAANISENVTIFSDSTTSTPVKIQPRAEDDPDSGKLCESDNDTIGQHLGCDCILLDGYIKSANCASKWIGYNATMNLPARLNISRHVRHLDLSKNHLQILDENTFGDCEGLQELNLYRNHIRSVTGLSCNRVRKLDLSWNNLSNLTNDAFKSLTQLVELDLSYNNLVIVEPYALDRLKNLRVLNMASNPLGQELNLFADYILSLDNLQFLEELDLSNTSLPDFPLSLIQGTQNIKRLRLATNQIISLPEGVLHELKNLEYLDLSGNWFEVLVPFGFNGLSSLNTLLLDQMPYLTKIDQHAFAGLTSLRELSCQKNQLLSFIDVMAFRMAQELEKEILEGDSHPKIVYLADNNLNYIEYGLLVWKEMELLELYRNPWICDCNLQWVAEFHKKKTADATILTDIDFACKEPHIFAGVPVAAVNAEEMLCYSPAATIAGTVAIILFGFLLFTFCSIIILNHMGMLPDWVRRYNIFGSGSSLPKYMRVNPKPTRARRQERMGVPERGEPVPGDLEWDSADIGPT